jgi:hypothetical protein
MYVITQPFFHRNVKYGFGNILGHLGIFFLTKQLATPIGRELTEPGLPDGLF